MFGFHLELGLLSQSQVTSLRLPDVHGAVRATTSLPVTHALLRSVYIESVSHHLDLIHLFCVGTADSSAHWSFHKWFGVSRPFYHYSSIT
jgi:hypothetical protein